MSRHTKDFNSVKTRQLAVQNPDGSFPGMGDVMTATDWRGSIQPTSDITLNSLTATNITVTGPIVQANIVATNIVSNIITTDDMVIRGNLTTSDISANTLVANSITSAGIASSCITATTLTTPAFTGGSITADDISGGSIATGSIVATNTVVTTVAATVTTPITMEATLLKTTRLNATDISATTAKITDLSAQSGYFSGLTAVDISVNTVTTKTANTQDLNVNNLITTGVFKFVTHTLNDLSSTLVTATDVSTGTVNVSDMASIGSVTASQFNVGQVNADAVNTSSISVVGTVQANAFNANTIRTGTLTGTAASIKNISGLTSLTATSMSANDITVDTYSGNLIGISSELVLNGASLTCVPTIDGLRVNGVPISSVWSMYPDPNLFSLAANNRSTIADISSTLSTFLTSLTDFMYIFSNRGIVIALDPSFTFESALYIQFLANGTPSIVTFPIGNNYLGPMIQSLNKVAGIQFSAPQPAPPSVSWLVNLNVASTGTYYICDASASSYYYSSLPMSSLQTLRYLGFNADPSNNLFETFTLNSRGLYQSTIKPLRGLYLANNPLNEQYYYPNNVPVPSIVYTTTDPYSISFQQNPVAYAGTLYLSIFQTGRGYSLYPGTPGIQQKIYDLAPSSSYSIQPIYMDNYNTRFGSTATLTTALIPAPTVTVLSTFNSINISWTQPYPGKIYTFTIAASGLYIQPSQLSLVSDISYSYINLVRNTPYTIRVQSYDNSFNAYSPLNTLNITTPQLTVPTPSVISTSNNGVRVTWPEPIRQDISATLYFQYDTITPSNVMYSIPSGSMYWDISGLADIPGDTDFTNNTCQLSYSDNVNNPRVDGAIRQFTFTSLFGIDLSANARFPLILDNYDTVGIGYTVEPGCPWIGNIVNQIKFSQNIIETTGDPATFVANAYMIPTANLSQLFSYPPWTSRRFIFPAPFTTSDPVILGGKSSSKPTVFFRNAKVNIVCNASVTTVIMFQKTSTTGIIQFPTFTVPSPLQDISAVALTYDRTNTLTNGFNTSLNGVACTFTYVNSYTEPTFTLTAPTPYDISFSLTNLIPSEVDNIRVTIIGGTQYPFPGTTSIFPNTQTAPITFMNLSPATQYVISVTYVRPYDSTPTTQTITTLPIPPPNIIYTTPTLNQITLDWDISYNSNYRPPAYLYQLDASGGNITPLTTRISPSIYEYSSLLQGVEYTITIRTYDPSFGVFSTPVTRTITTTAVNVPLPVLRRGPLNTSVDISFSSSTPSGVTGTVNYLLGTSQTLTTIPIPPGATSVNVAGFTVATDISSCFIAYSDGKNNNLGGPRASTFQYDPSFGFYDTTSTGTVALNAGYTISAGSQWIGYTLNAISFPQITATANVAFLATIYNVPTSLLTGLTAPPSYNVTISLTQYAVASSYIGFLTAGVAAIPTLSFASPYTIRDPASGTTTIILLQYVAGSMNAVFPGFGNSSANATQVSYSGNTLSNEYLKNAPGLICQFNWLTSPTPLQSQPSISSNGVISPNPYSLRYVLNPPQVSSISNYVSFTYTQPSGTLINVLYSNGSVDPVNATTVDISGVLPPATTVTDMVLYYFKSGATNTYNVPQSVIQATRAIPAFGSVTATNITINSFLLSWVPPAQGNNITYQYTITPDANPGTHIITAQSQQFTQLLHGSRYSFSVFAYDSAYPQTQYRSASSVLDISTNPLTVIGPTIQSKPSTNTTITISWSTTGSISGFSGPAAENLSYSINNSGTIANYSVPIIPPINTSPYITSYDVSQGLSTGSVITAFVTYTDGANNTVITPTTAPFTFVSQFGFSDASNNSVTPFTLGSGSAIGYAIPDRSKWESYVINAITFTQNITEISGNNVGFVARIYDIPNSSLNLGSAPFSSSVTLPAPAATSYAYFLAANSKTTTPPTLYFSSPYAILDTSSNPLAKTTVILFQVVAGAGTIQVPTFKNGAPYDPTGVLYDVSANAISVTYTGTTLSNAFVNQNGNGTICQFFNITGLSPTVPSVPTFTGISTSPYDISYNLTNLGINTNYVSYTDPTNKNTLLPYGTTNPVTIPNLIPYSTYTNLIAYYAGPSVAPAGMTFSYGPITFYATNSAQVSAATQTNRLNAPTSLVATGITINSLPLSWTATTPTYPGRTIMYDISWSGVLSAQTSNTSYTIATPNTLLHSTLYNISVYAYDPVYSAKNYYSLPLSSPFTTAPLSVTNLQARYKTNTNTIVRMTWQTSSLVGQPSATGTVLYSIAGAPVQSGGIPVAQSPTSYYYDIPITLTQIKDVSCSVSYTDNGTNVYNSAFVSTVFDPSFGFYNATPLTSGQLVLAAALSYGYSFPSGSTKIGYTFNSVSFPQSVIEERLGSNVAVAVFIYEVSSTSLILPAPVASSYTYFLNASTTAAPTLTFSAPYTIVPTTVILFRIIAGNGTIRMPTCAQTGFTGDWTSLSYTGTGIPTASTNGILCQFNYINTAGPSTPPAPSVSSVISTNPYSLSYTLNNLLTSYTSYVSLLKAGDLASALYSFGTTNPIEVSGLIPNTVYSLTFYYAGVAAPVTSIYNTNAAVFASNPVSTLQLPAPSLSFTDISYNAITANFAMPTTGVYSGKTYRYILTATPNPSVAIPSPLSVTKYTLYYLAHSTAYNISVTAYDLLYTSQTSSTTTITQSTATLSINSLQVTPVANSNSQAQIRWSPVLPTGYDGTLATGTLTWDISRGGVISSSGTYNIPANIMIYPTTPGLPLANLLTGDVISCRIEYKDGIRNTVSSSYTSPPFTTSFGLGSAINNAPNQFIITPGMGIGYTFPSTSPWEGYGFRQLNIANGITVSNGTVALVAKVYSVSTASLVYLYSSPASSLYNLGVPDVSSYVYFAEPSTSLQYPTFSFPIRTSILNDTGGSQTIVLIQIVAGTGSVQFPTFSNNYNGNTDYQPYVTSLYYDANGYLSNPFIADGNNYIGNGLNCTFYDIPVSPAVPPTPTTSAVTKLDPYTLSYTLGNLSTYTNYLSYITPGGVNTLLPYGTRSSILVENLIPASSYANMTVYYAGISTTAGGLTYYASNSNPLGTQTTLPIAAMSTLSLSSTTIQFNSISLQWNALSYTGKTIRYDISGNGSGAQRVTVPNTSYTMNGLLRGTSYTFTVFPYDASGNGLPQYNGASQAITAPSASLSVSNLQIRSPVPNNNTSVTFSWNTTSLAGVPNASGTLYYSIGGVQQTPYSVPVSETSYTIPSVLLQYATDVSAIVYYTDGAANTINSGIVSYTTFTSSFGFTLTPISANQLTISSSTSIGYAVPAGSPWLGYTANSLTLTGIRETAGAAVAIAALVYSVSAATLSALASGSVTSFTLPPPVATSYTYFMTASATPASTVLSFPDTFTIHNPTSSGSGTLILLRWIDGSGVVQLPTFSQNPSQGATALTVSYTGTTLASNSVYGLNARFGFTLPPATIAVPAVNSTPISTPFSLQYSVSSIIGAGIYYSYLLNGVRLLNNTSTSPITIPNLIPNTSYTITFYSAGITTPYATNSVSYTNSSSAISTPALSVASATTDTVTVSWTSASGYSYRLTSGTQVLFSSSNSQMFQNLIHNTPYTINMAAFYTIQASKLVTWLDKSGRGNNAAAVGNPVIQAIQGKNYVYLDGASWFTGPIINTGQQVTTFSVVQIPSAQTVNTRIVSLASSLASDFNLPSYVAALYVFNGTTNIATYRNNAGISSGANTLDVPVIASSVYTGANGELYVNGNLDKSYPSLGNFAISDYGIGNQAYNSGEVFKGSIGETIVYSGALDAQQQQGINTYLKNKWSTNNSLQVWYDGKDPNGTGNLPTNGTTITRWVNKAGNRAYDAVIAQGYGGATYSSATNSLVFPDTGINGTTAYNTGYPGNPTTETMFIVFSSNGSHPFLMAGPQGVRAFGAGSAYNNANAVGLLNSEVLWLAVTPTGSYTPSSVALATAYMNGLDSYVSINAGATTSMRNGPAFYAGTTTYLGIDLFATQYYYAGNIMEVRIYNTVLPDSEIQIIQRELATKWSITIPASTAFTAPVTPSLKVWYDAADPAGTGVLPANGTEITTWANKVSGGSANNAVAQGVAVFTTTPKTLQFNGVSSYTTGYTASDLSETVFVVANSTENGSVSSNLILNGSSNGRGIYLDGVGGRAGVGVTGAVATAPYVSGATTITTTQMLDGIAYISQNQGGYYRNNNVTIANNKVTTLGPFVGNVMEILIYNAVLEPPQIAQIQQYLITKWQIPIVTDISGCKLWLDPTDSTTLSNNYYGPTVSVMAATQNLSIGTPTITSLVTNNTAATVTWTTNPTTVPSGYSGTLYYTLGTSPPTAISITASQRSYSIPGLTLATNITNCYVLYKNSIVDVVNSSAASTYPYDPSFGFNAATQSNALSIGLGFSHGYVIPANSPWIGYTLNSVVFSFNFTESESQYAAIAVNIYEVPTVNISPIYSGNFTAIISNISPPKRSSNIVILTPNQRVIPTFTFDTPYQILNPTSGLTTVILIQMIAGSGSFIPTFKNNTNGNRDYRTYATSVSYDSGSNEITNYFSSPEGYAPLCQFNYLMPLNPPSAPSIVNVVSNTPYTFTVTTFQAVPIGVTVYALLGSNLYFCGNASPIIIPGLAPSTTYPSLVLYYASTTSILVSSSVPYTGALTTQTLPAPTIISSSSGFTSVSLSWSNLSSTYTNRTFGYSITSYAGGGGFSPQNVFTTSTTIPVPGTDQAPLNNASLYIVSIKAYDIEYDSKFSSDVSTNIITLLPPPTISTGVAPVSAITYNSITINWTRPTFTFTSASETATISPTFIIMGAPTSPISVPSTKNTNLIEGLQPNTIYNFSVFSQVITATGTIESTRLQMPESQTTALLPPTGLTESEKSVTSFKLGWTLPQLAPGGSAVKYYATYAGSPQTPTYYDSSPQTIPNLFNGTLYSVTMRTYDPATQTPSGPSEPLSVRTLVPSPPSGSTSQVTYDSVLLTWSNPVFTVPAGAAVTYSIFKDGVVAVTGINPASGQNTKLMEALTPKTKYTFSITANYNVPSAPLILGEITTDELKSPYNLTSPSKDITSFALNWATKYATLPPGGGGLYYVAEYRISPNGAYQFKEIANTATSTSITDLNNATTYEVYLYTRSSTTSAVSDPPSNTIQVTTTLPAPISPSRTDITYNSVKLSWTNPTFTGVTGVVYYIDGTEEPSPPEVPSSESTTVITGLTPNRTYNLSIYSRHVASGVESAYVSIPEFRTATLLPPSDIYSPSKTFTSFVLKWTPPYTGLTDESTLRYYAAYRAGSVGPVTTFGPILPSAISARITTGINNGTTYTVYMYTADISSNPLVTSLPSNLIDVTIDLPPPTNPGYTSVTYDSVRLTWSKPTFNVSPVTFVIEKNGSIVTQAVPSSQEYYDVSGLTPSTAYKFKVYSLYGTNPSTAIKSSEIQFGPQGSLSTDALGPPTNVSLGTATADSVLLYWTNPTLTPGGGAVAYYYRYTWLYGASTVSSGTFGPVTPNPYTIRSVYNGLKLNIRMFTKDTTTGYESGDSLTLGESTIPIPPAMNGSVTYPAASPTGTTAVLSWTAPTINVLSGWQIVYSVYLGSTLVSTDTTTTRTITGLLQNASYTYNVYSGIRQGPLALLTLSTSALPITAVIPLPPPTAATTPISLKTYDSVRLHWAPPLFNIQGVTFTITGGPTTITGILPTATFGDVTGLIPKTTYTFTVYSQVGTTRSTTGLEIKDITTTELFPPTGITYEFGANGANTIIFNWTKPTLPSGGGLVKYYVTYRAGAGAEQIYPPGGTTDTTTTITGLNNLTKYNAYMYTFDTTTNTRGTLSELFRPETNLPPPTSVNPSYQFLSYDSVRVLWGAAPFTANITDGKYQFTYGALDVLTTATYFDISGLTQNTSHTFTICSLSRYNAIPPGYNASTSISVEATTTAVPVPTIQPIVNPGPTSFNLAWSIPTPPQGAGALQFYALVSSVLYGPFSTSPQPITGLQNAAPYSVVMYAKDSVGNQSANSTAVQTQTTLPAVTNATTTITPTSVLLKWQFSTTATGVVFVITRNGTTLIDNLAQSITSYLDNGFTPLSTTVYTIYAKTGSLTGPVVTVNPWTPITSLTLTTVSATAMKAVWAPALPSGATGVLSYYVRISSPLAIAGCKLWLDGADRSSIITTDTWTTTWTDKSGSGNNASSGPPPTVVGSGGILMNGTNNYFISPLSVDFMNHCLIAVHKPASDAANTSLFRFQSTMLPSYVVFPYTFDGTKYGYINSQRGLDPLPDNSTPSAINVIVANIASGEQRIYKNGVQQSSGTSALTSATTLTLTIGRVAGGSQYYGGTIYEMIAYNRQLTGDEINQITAYLQNKWYQPIQIPGCVLWLDAADASTVTTQSSAPTQIQTWNDKSGTGNTATYAQNQTYSSQISYNPSLSHVYFGGSGNQYGSLLTTLNNIPQDTHCLIAVIRPSNTDGSFVFNSSTQLTFPTYQSYYKNPSMTPTSNLPAPTYSTSSVSVIMANVKSGAQQMYINGILNGNLAGTIPTGSTFKIQIGAGLGFTGDNLFYYGGFLYEVIVYNRFLTDTEIKTITNYLTKKWSNNLSSVGVAPNTYSIPTGGTSYDIATSGVSNVSCEVAYTDSTGNVSSSSSANAWNYTLSFTSVIVNRFLPYLTYNMVSNYTYTGPNTIATVEIGAIDGNGVEWLMATIDSVSLTSGAALTNTNANANAEFMWQYRNHTAFIRLKINGIYGYTSYYGPLQIRYENIF